MAGAVLIVLVMVLLGPIALFVGGALWSSFIGSALVREQSRAADAAPAEG